MNGLSRDEWVRRSYRTFLASLASVMTILIALALCLPQYMMILIPMLALPVLITSIYANMPSRSLTDEQRGYLIDAPTVIGMVSMGLHLDHSLATSISQAKTIASTPLGKRLSMAVWESVFGRGEEDHIGGLTSELGPGHQGLAQSLNLLRIAENESARESKERVLERANHQILEDLKETMDEYLAKLTFPVMIIFSFGILAPVMLFSLIPMLGIGGMTDGEGAFDLGTLSLILLILVPLVTFIFTRTVLERNPAMTSSRWPPLERGLVIRLSVILALGVMAAVVIGNGPVILMVTFIAASLMVRRSGIRGYGVDDAREMDMLDALFQIGNCMLQGKGFEDAFEKTCKDRGSGPFYDWARSIILRSRVSGEGLKGLLRGDIERSDGSMVSTCLLPVMEGDEKDPEWAGNMAINLAQQYSDMMKCKRRIVDAQRTITEMMRSTATFFAPLIVGLTSSMMLLMSERLSTIENDRLYLTIGAIYLVQLMFVVQYFIMMLEGRKESHRFLWNYLSRGAIALFVFIIASQSGLTFLAHLL